MEIQEKLINVDEDSEIPLFGLDFLGILDRGTNVLEVKPITICNLRCKYCFVSAGDYKINFIAEKTYLINKLKEIIQFKQDDNIEIHFAPYGEIMLYPDLFNLIAEIKAIPEVKTISIQTNGLLLTAEKILKLEEAGVNRLNISLNSLDSEQCAKFCGVKSYDLELLLKMFEIVIKSSMELLIAPVWFMGKNDQGIFDIINYVKIKETDHNISWPKLRLGIQNYLSYKTGRKLKKVHSREFKHFYKRLTAMEKESGLKLKLGPNDFNIHRAILMSPPVNKGHVAEVEVVMKGRWKNEYICSLNSEWGVKLLCRNQFSPKDKVIVKFVKSTLSGNLLTAILEQ
jgi:uncharacterized protein